VPKVPLKNARHLKELNKAASGHPPQWIAADETRDSTSPLRNARVYLD
jgi:hypothetical protein